MRTYEDISKIKSNISQPYAIYDFISSDEVAHLINLYRSNTNIFKKITGVDTLDNNHIKDDNVVKLILDRIKEQIGRFDVAASLFFYATYPHIIHNDDTYQLPNNVYKAISITLDLEGEPTGFPRLCLFDQFYFHGPSKFFKGSAGSLTAFNKNIYEYSNVDGLVDYPLVDENDYLSHLKPEWYEGLSINSTFEQRPGTAVIFDSTRLHCSSDFRKLGITGKLGLSIFTTKC